MIDMECIIIKREFVCTRALCFMLDGQLRTWEKGSIYYSIKIYVLNWAKKKEKKVKGVLLQDHKSSTILSVLYWKMNNKKPK